MATVKANRNKTIDTPLSKGQVYLENCIAVTQKQANFSQIPDKIIIGNMLDVCLLLPVKNVDLIIADPHIILRNLLTEQYFPRKKMLIMRNIPVVG